MKQFIIHTNAKNYNPNRTYFRNANRHARTYTADTLAELETRKAELIAKGEIITGIYTNTGKRVG